MIENDRDSPDLKVGVRFHQVFRVWFFSVATRGEVTRITENEELELGIRQSGGLTRCCYTLKPNGSERTHVVQTVELHPTMLFALPYILFKWPASWLVRRQANRNLKRLKSACESCT